jgi:hypothetical protein
VSCGLAGQPVLLEFGNFAGTNTGPVTLQILTRSGRATGTATVATLDVVFDRSDLPEFQAGVVLRFQATIDDTGSLRLTNLTTGFSSISAPLPPPTVFLGLPSAPVTPETTFTVPVVFDAAAVNVVSYLFELTFNSQVVNVVSIQGVAPFDPVVTNPAVFTSGAVRFAANNSTFTPARGRLTLANITLHVIGASGTTSPLTLAFATVPGGTSVIAHETFQPIANVTFINGAVQVQ